MGKRKKKPTWRQMDNIDHQFEIFGFQAPQKRIRLSRFERKEAKRAVETKDLGLCMRILVDVFERIERQI